MADVFISYSKTDKQFASTLASALISVGCTVWWDRDIAHGKYFDRIIEEEIQKATVVIVVWSIAGRDSDWCRAEAASALEQNKLLPVSIQDAKPPLRFMHIQTGDMTNWSGDLEDEPFLLLSRDLRLHGISVAGIKAAPQEDSGKKLYRLYNVRDALPPLVACILGVLAAYAVDYVAVKVAFVWLALAQWFPGTPLENLGRFRDMWTYFLMAIACASLMTMFFKSVLAQSVAVGVFCASFSEPFYYLNWSPYSWEAVALRLGISIILLACLLFYRHHHQFSER